MVIWLVGAVHQLGAARRALADEAVIRERLRIDADLRQAIGGSLEAMAASAMRATLESDAPATTEATLRGLVETSRRTLTEMRRVVRSYQRGSLRAELNSAIALLTAAGIETRVAIPDDLPGDVQDRLRSELRVATSQLLRAEGTRWCVIGLRGQAGEPLGLELHSDRSDPHALGLGAT